MSDDQAAAILAAIQRLEAGHESLRAEVTGRFAEVNSRFAEVTASLAEVTGGLAEVTGGLAEVTGRLARVETAQERLRTDIMGKLERIDDALTAIREDITVNMGAVEQMRRLNHNTREELHGLHDVVAALQRQILRIESEVAELRRKYE